MRPFIVLTGDDSIRAEGLILVKRIVEKFADFKIVGTKVQQSAAGARLTTKPVEWGTEMVDGVEAIWVDGSPADSVYFAREYLDRKPDLIISGMNIGENIENETMFISGTIGAALIASQALNIPTIAFSLQIDFDDDHSWRKEHNGEFDEKLLEYPGRMIEKIIKAALTVDFPSKVFWNVNFPMKPTEVLKVVKTGNAGYFPNKRVVEGNMTNFVPSVDTSKVEADTDSGELTNGFATLSPCKIEFTDFGEMERLKRLNVFYNDKMVEISPKVKKLTGIISENDLKKHIHKGDTRYDHLVKKYLSHDEQ